jgi:2-isopropylmalate synthase
MDPLEVGVNVFNCSYGQSGRGIGVQSKKVGYELTKIQLDRVYIEF